MFGEPINVTGIGSSFKLEIAPPPQETILRKHPDGKPLLTISAHTAGVNPQELAKPLHILQAFDTLGRSVTESSYFSALAVTEGMYNGMNSHTKNWKHGMPLVIEERKEGPNMLESNPHLWARAVKNLLLTDTNSDDIGKIAEVSNSQVAIPKLQPEGEIETRIEYDTFGRPVKVSYFQEEKWPGESVVVPTGEDTFIYDADGRIATTAEYCYNYSHREEGYAKVALFLYQQVDETTVRKFHLTFLGDPFHPATTDLSSSHVVVEDINIKTGKNIARAYYGKKTSPSLAELEEMGRMHAKGPNYNPFDYFSYQLPANADESLATELQNLPRRVIFPKTITQKDVNLVQNTRFNSSYWSPNSSTVYIPSLVNTHTT